MARFGTGQDRTGTAQQRGCHRQVALAFFACPCLATPCPGPIDLTGLSRADLSRFPLGEARPGQPDQAKGVAAWGQDGIVGWCSTCWWCRCEWGCPGHKSMRLLVTRTYLFRRFLSVVYCQLEWVEGGSGVGKGERAVCRLAIQGRVSQNLRLIQVIFGHTASEAKGVCVCVCQCACEMRVRVSVCVQTRSRPKVTENSTAKQDAAVFLYSRNRPKSVVDFSIQVCWWYFVV